MFTGTDSNSTPSSWSVQRTRIERVGANSYSCIISSVSATLCAELLTVVGGPLILRRNDVRTYQISTAQCEVGLSRNERESGSLFCLPRRLLLLSILGRA